MAHAVDALLLKLRRGTTLTEVDEQKLGLLCHACRQVEPHHDLIREGDCPENVHLVLDGFAIRYKLLANGRRQTLALLLPSDFCDLHMAILGKMDHCVATLTACRIVEIARGEINALVDYPRILHGLWWASLVDEAVLRERLVSMGQRNADQQMAHFRCEMFVRLGLIGRVHQDSFDLPMTQQDIGDVLGLSTVHVNRTLQDLRGAGLVEARRTRINIPDVERLFAHAGFNADYLHLVKRVDKPRESKGLL